MTKLIGYDINYYLNDLKVAPQSCSKENRRGKYIVALLPLAGYAILIQWTNLHDLDIRALYGRCGPKMYVRRAVSVRLRTLLWSAPSPV